MKNSNIKYIILFISIIFIIDIIGGKILKSQFRNISFGTYGNINNSINSNSEIMILGSSRAMHHYNSKVLSKQTKVSCYNSGLGGYGFFYNYAILDEKIKKGNLKIIILDISPNVIVDAKSYDKLNLLLPYYKDYNSFKEIIRLDSEFSQLELASNMYLYNSTLYDFFRSSIVKKVDNNYGFLPLNGTIDENNFVPMKYNNEKIDTNKFIYLKKIINLCSLNDIKLIGVVSPTYLKYDVNNIVINQFKSVFDSNKLEFYDYSDFYKLYNTPKYFKDQLHLNKLGAEVFSEELANKIVYGL